MTSIFDPPAGTHRFTAADWLATIDLQLQAPAAPPADEAEQIADDWPTAEEPLPTTQPATTRRQVRNLPWAIVATCAAMAAIMIYILATINAFGEPFSLVWIALLDPPLWLLWAALTALALELLIWLLAAWRFDRL